MATYNGAGRAGNAVEAGIGFVKEQQTDTTALSPPATQRRTFIRPGPRAAYTATAVGFGDRPPAREMKLVNWRRSAKGRLRGFATIQLPIWLKISDCPVFVSNGKARASPPSKPQIDADGHHYRDVNGKPAYTAMLAWRSRELADRFSEAVVRLVRESHPEALDELPLRASP
jgi:hypothetical protein